MLSEDDLISLKIFTAFRPNWWYKIGVCDRTRDFDCAPQGNAKEIEYIEKGLWTDDCFSCDHEGTISDAILQVMDDINKCEYAAISGIKIDIRTLETIS